MSIIDHQECVSPVRPARSRGGDICFWCPYSCDLATQSFRASPTFIRFAYLERHSGHNSKYQTPISEWLAFLWDRFIQNHKRPSKPWVKWPSRPLFRRRKRLVVKGTCLCWRYISDVMFMILWYQTRNDHFDNIVKAIIISPIISITSTINSTIVIISTQRPCQ